MKKQFVYALMPILFIAQILYGQSVENTKTIDGVSILFRNDSILPIKLTFSNSNVKRNTNDSTYIKTDLSYLQQNGSWKTLEIKIRARGNFRHKKCYYSPLKVKIKKTEYKNTLFDKNKTLKFVLPCLKEKGNNDNVVEEYMAYKLFEIVSPYHFKTRLIDLDYSEVKRKNTVQHKIKGLIIENDKKVAKRFDGNVYDRFMHPLNQDATASVRNAFFQFMIGNTDFDNTYAHNGKLMFINKKMLYIPYDFDMSGLVNASYSVVSDIQNETLPIDEVTQRIYRGYKRDLIVFTTVRKEFLNNKIEILELVTSLEPYFNNPKEYSKAKAFISSFFEILTNENRFQKEIINAARTM